jgi:pimeloyl-ACP methyl ester carboxylesterase
MAPTWQAQFQSINGIKLHVRCRGEAKTAQPPVLCLHGFPDLGTVWQRVIAHLPQDRLYVVPDQRGYHMSDKPDRVSDYAPECLLEDIRHLILTYAPDGKVVLAGHDWGGVIATWFAARYPEAVDRLILINAIHPAVLQKALSQDREQRAASAYMMALKSGALEAGWQRDPKSNPFKAWFKQAQEEGRMAQDEAALYNKAWSDPDRWRAAIDWYRASPFEISPSPELPAWVTSPDWMIQAPTHVIWGEADPVFTVKTRDAMAPYFTKLTMTALAGIGHNPLRDDPASVAKAIQTFLDQGKQHV